MIRCWVDKRVFVLLFLGWGGLLGNLLLGIEEIYMEINKNDWKRYFIVFEFWLSNFILFVFGFEICGGCYFSCYLFVLIIGYYD